MRPFREVFGPGKVVIAMVHLPPLPGTPMHEASAGMEAIVDSARADVLALQAAGVDALMFGNENDRPYELSVDVASTAAMAFVIGCIKAELKLPYGVDVLWDPLSTIALAAATGAAFVREIFTGVYASDMGLWQGRAAQALRYARLVGRDDLCLLHNISAEFASSMDRRGLADRARSAVFSSLANAILVSGPLTGEAAPLEHIAAVKNAVPETPVLANTGVRHDAVRDVLDVADGVIVGTALKRDGITWNPVDPERARAFVQAAGTHRDKT